MSVTTTFDVAVTRDRAFTYLSNPRNLFSANHEGPIVGRSGGPSDAGSWFVLQFDHIRARVEYTVVERDRHIAARTALTFASFGQVWWLDVVLTPLDGGSRTRVELTGDAQGGWLPRWLVRSQQSRWATRLRRNLEAPA